MSLLLSIYFLNNAFNFFQILTQVFIFLVIYYFHTSKNVNT